MIINFHPKPKTLTPEDQQKLDQVLSLLFLLNIFQFNFEKYHLSILLTVIYFILILLFKTIIKGESVYTGQDLLQNNYS